MHAPDDPFWTAPQAPLPVELADYSLDLPKLGWRVEGMARTQEILIRIPKNRGKRVEVEPYAWRERLHEGLSRRPRRPDNDAVKYDAPVYSSARPYPITEAHPAA
jgi:hypothetical protein